MSLLVFVMLLVGVMGARRVFALGCCTIVAAIFRGFVMVVFEVFVWWLGLWVGVV